MIIDIHEHVTAPPVPCSYRSSLLSSREGGGRGNPNVDDEKLKNAVRSGRGKKHPELLKELFKLKTGKA